MKKCHSCGTAREDSEMTLLEVDEKYYCIFCLDSEGKPRNHNNVREGIKTFWRYREKQNQNSDNLES